MVKRMLSLALMLCMIMSILNAFSVSVSAESQSSSTNVCGDNLSYSINGSTLTISGNGEMYDFRATVNAIVGERKRPWDGDNIKKVVIKKGVTSIGAYAFYRFEQLSEIVIEADIESIGDMAFYSCYNLKNISLPKCLKVIGESAFTSCTNLTELIIPDQVVSIRNTAFDDCSGLKKVVFGKNLTEIGERAFTDCSFMDTITLGDSIEVIGEGAFSNCDSLTNINYTGNSNSTKALFEENRKTNQLVFIKTNGKIGENITWKFKNNTLIVSGSGKLSCDKLSHSIFRKINAKKLIIESGITEIYEGFISGNHSLEEVVLPDTLQKLGIYTFHACKNIKVVQFPETEFIIEGGCFEGCVNLTNVYLPEKAKLEGAMPFGDISYGNPERIPITFYVAENSPAYTWATRNGFSVVVFTRAEFNEKFNITDEVKFTAVKSNKALYQLPKFNDINTTDEYTEYILSLGYLNLFKGDNLGNFNPGQSLTRAECATLVCRMLGYEEEAIKYNGQVVFNDVPASHWASGYIYVASQLGIINGYGNGMFGPQDPVLYEQAIKMVLCAIQYNEPMLCASYGIACLNNEIPYPQGYIQLAKQLEMYGDCSQNAQAPRKIIAELLYHTIMLNGIVEQEDRDGTVNYSASGDTILQKIFGISSGDEWNNLLKNTDSGSLGANIENNVDFSENATVFDGKSADKVNDAIHSIHSTETGLVMVIDENTDFDKIQKNDVFFLEGDSNTPFGEPFIGKVSHITDNGKYRSVNIIEPALDEVFDQLSVNTTDKMEIDEIKEFYVIDGLKPVAAIPSQPKKNMIASHQEASAEEHSPKITKFSNLFSNTSELSYQSIDPKLLLASSSVEEPRKISLSGSIDLMNLFKLDKGSGLPATRVYWLESENTTQKETEHIFHLVDCQYIREKLWKCNSCAYTEVDYIEEKSGLLLNPCKKCFPNTYDDKKPNFSPQQKMKLDLSLTIDDLQANPIVNFDVSQGGLRDLAITVSGDITFNTTLSASIEGNLESETTSKKLDALNQQLKLSGLKEKSMPLFFLAWSPGAGTSLTYDNEKLENIPVTFGVMGYIDVEGKLSLDASIGWSYKWDNLGINATLYKDGQLSPNVSIANNGTSWELPISVNAGGDLTESLAVSGMFYVFNVNIAELALVKLEFNTNGTATLSCKYGSAKEEPPKFEVDGYMNAYLKIGEISLKAKLSYDTFIADGSYGTNYKATFLKHKIFELGTLLSTDYNRDTMGVGFCTAYDEKYNYFKDKNGYLIQQSKENPNDTNIIYRNSFYSIAAIDKSYVYVLANADNNTYKMYRISKNGIFADRMILDNIKRVFHQDNTYIYYVDADSLTEITKIDRKDLMTYEHAKFDDKIVEIRPYRLAENNQYYVMTYKPSWLDFMGDITNYCYVIDQNGSIIKDLGEVDSLNDYYLSEYDNYVAAARLQSKDIMDDTWALNVRWANKNGTESNEASSTGGWRYDESGIFVIQNNNSGIDNRPYMLKILNAKSGKITDIVTLNSNQVFRTIQSIKITDYNQSGSKSENKIWYFIDQTSDGKWILYEVSSNFLQVKKIQEYSTSIDLSTCNVCAIGNTLYIYSAKTGGDSVLIGTYTY